MFIETPVSKFGLSNKKPLYGVGVNNAPYHVYYKINGVRIICPFYRKWQGMIIRCYSKNKYKTYKDCTVCDEWKNFMSFKKWMESQDWKDKELDKDILVFGNKLYSPETCIFVTHKINGLVNDQSSRRGKYPQGVSYDAKRNKFASYCRVKNKTKFLGYFDTPEEASEKYRAVKKNEFIRCAELARSDKRLYDALMTYAGRFTNER